MKTFKMKYAIIVDCVAEVDAKNKQEAMGCVKRIFEHHPLYLNATGGGLDDCSFRLKTGKNTRKLLEIKEK